MNLCTPTIQRFRVATLISLIFVMFVLNAGKALAGTNKVEVMSPAPGQLIAGNIVLSAHLNLSEPGIADATWRFSQGGSAWVEIPHARTSTFNQEAFAIWDTNELKPGSYQLEVLITDSSGSVATQQLDVKVTRKPELLAELWYFDDDRALEFDASRSTSWGGELKFTWDFGDGTTQAGATAKHKFGNPEKTQFVTLTAIDENGFDAFAVYELIPAQAPEFIKKDPSQKPSGEKYGGEMDGEHGILISTAFCGVDSLDIVTAGNSVVAVHRNPNPGVPALVPIRLGAHDTIPANLNRLNPRAPAFDYYMAVDVVAKLVKGSTPALCEEMQLVKFLARNGGKLHVYMDHKVTISPWTMLAVQRCPIGGNDWCDDQYSKPITERQADGSLTDIKKHGKDLIAWFDGVGHAALTKTGLWFRSFPPSQIAIQGEPTGIWMEAAFLSFVLGTNGQNSWQCDWEVKYRVTYSARTGDTAKVQAPAVFNENCRQVNMVAH